MDTGTVAVIVECAIRLIISNKLNLGRIMNKHTLTYTAVPYLAVGASAMAIRSVL